MLCSHCGRDALRRRHRHTLSSTSSRDVKSSSWEVGHGDPAHYVIPSRPSSAVAQLPPPLVSAAPASGRGQVRERYRWAPVRRVGDRVDVLLARRRRRRRRRWLDADRRATSRGRRQLSVLVMSTRVDVAKLETVQRHQATDSQWQVLATWT